MFKRRQFVPLITRITGMFAVLIIAACVVAGVFSSYYRVVVYKAPLQELW